MMPENISAQRVKTVVSLSGGKDSTAMLLRMLEIGEPVDKIIFADTRKEFPELYNYLDRVEEYTGREITRLEANTTWEAWFYGKFTRGKHEGERRGFPFVVYPCWAMRELKYKPLTKACNGGTMCIGFAADEPKRYGRKIYREGNFRFPLVEWGWTEADCLEYLKKKGMMNPLNEYFWRLGCWCCPKQSNKSLRIIREKWPDLWKELLRMESENPREFKPNFRLEALD